MINNLPKNYTQEHVNNEFRHATYCNNFELIKELLTSANLEFHAQINQDSTFIGNICSHKDLITLRYVLTSTELKEHAHLHLDSQKALRCAIYTGNIEAIDYLLNSSDLNTHSNLYHLDHYANTPVFEVIFKINDRDIICEVIDYLTLKYSREHKDARIYHELFRYCNPKSFEIIIKNLLSSILSLDPYDMHKCELESFLRLYDEKMYNNYLFKEKLEQGIVTVENTKTISKL